MNIIEILFGWIESDVTYNDIIEDINWYLKLAKEKKEMPPGWKRRVRIYEMRFVEWKIKTKLLDLNAQKE